MTYAEAIREIKATYPEAHEVRFSLSTVLVYDRDDRGEPLPLLAKDLARLVATISLREDSQKVSVTHGYLK